MGSLYVSCVLPKRGAIPQSERFWLFLKEQRDKEIKLQVLNASCVVAQELIEHRSEQIVVKPAAQLLDPYLN